MNFFEDIRGHLYPTSAIVSVGPAKEVTFKSSRDDAGKYAGVIHEVELSNGQEVEIRDWMLKHIKRQAAQIIPALPETWIINRDDDDPDVVYREPVVAWAWTEDEGPVPVTLEGPQYETSGDLLLPDGSVNDPHFRSWVGINAWKADHPKLSPGE